MSPAGNNIQVINAFEVKIEGSPLSSKLQGAITLVEVEQRLNAPSAAILSFHDTAIEGDSVMDETPLKLGKAIKISAKSGENGSLEPLFEGEITTVDFELEGGGSYVSVKAHSKMQRLYHGSKIEALLNKKYSEVASAMAGGAGLSGSVDATTEVFKHVPQAWISDGAMLERMAAEVGYVFYCWDDKLNFKKPAWSADSGVTVTHGVDLLRFRSSSSSEASATEVEVRSWDPEKKAAIVGKATTVKANGVGLPKDPATEYKSYGGNAPLVVHAPPVPTNGAADTLAKAISDRIGDSASYAQGLCLGNPKIVPNTKLKVDNVPTPVKGSYFVTTVRHVFLDGEYHTEFTCAGGSSIPAFVPAGERSTPQSEAIGPLHPRGLVVLQGIVTNNAYADADGGHAPHNVPAVKVKFPTLDESKESDWYRVVQPGAGKERGLLVMPEVEDEVLVAFAGGDMRVGYVLGGLWNGKDKPGKELESAAAVVDGAVNKRGLVSRTGQQIILDDKDGEERILIMNAAGTSQVLFSAKDKTILVENDQNKVLIDAQNKKIDVTSTGDITLKADGKINLEATQDIVLKSTGKTSFEATQDLEMKGMNVKLAANAQFEAKGNAGVKVESPAITQVKGSLVQIN